MADFTYMRNGDSFGIVVRYNNETHEFEGYNYKENRWKVWENPDINDIDDNYFHVSEERAMEVIEMTKARIRQGKIKLSGS